MKKILLFLFFPSIVFLLEKEPWLGNIYQFTFSSKYSYFYFSKVDSAIEQPKKTNHNNLVCFSLDFPFSSKASVDADLIFVDTPRQTFSFNSFAMQFRYLVLDDITKNVISLIIFEDMKIASNKSVKDISTYDMGRFEMEAGFSLGKEFDQMEFWLFRGWFNFLAGIANKGSPWIKGILSFDLNNKDKYSLFTFLEATHSYGRKVSINIKNFKGYGEYREKSLSFGTKFSYKLNVWGNLAFEYKRKFYAKRGPEKVNYFTLTYELPFSL